MLKTQRGRSVIAVTFPPDFFLLKINLMNNILHLWCNIHYLLSYFIQGHTNRISVGLNIYMFCHRLHFCRCVIEASNTTTNELLMIVQDGGDHYKTRYY